MSPLVAAHRTTLGGHVPNALNDLKWCIEVRPEFATPSAIEGCNWSVQQVKPHPLVNGELRVTMLVVVVALLLLMRMFQPLPNLHEELIMVHQLVFHGWEV
jgi:hypothetical protein